jgi:hypothetical protein
LPNCVGRVASEESYPTTFKYLIVNKKIPTHLNRDFKYIIKNAIVFAVGFEPTRSKDQRLEKPSRLPFRHAAIIHQQELINSGHIKKIPGSVLLSHTVARAVPSTLRGSIVKLNCASWCVAWTALLNQLTYERL